MKTYGKETERLAIAIERLANNPEALENMTLYLSNHFDVWLNKFASAPADLAAEFTAFANIEF